MRKRVNHRYRGGTDLFRLLRRHLPLNRSLRSLGKALTTAARHSCSLFPLHYLLHFRQHLAKSEFHSRFKNRSSRSMASERFCMDEA